MEDGAHRTWSMSILMLFILLATYLPMTQAEDSSNEFIVDDRVQMISLSGGEVYQQSMEVDEGTIVSVNVGCSSCEVQLEAEDTTLISSSTVTYKATETITVEISISSTIAETVSTSFLVAEDESHLSQRPSPQTSIDLVDSFGLLTIFK